MRYLLPNKVTEGADPKSIIGLALSTATFRGGKGVKVGNDIPVTEIPKVKNGVINTGGLLKQYLPGFWAMTLRDLEVADGTAPGTTNVKNQSSIGIEPGGAAERFSIPVIVILTGSLGLSMDRVLLIPFPPVTAPAVLVEGPAVPEGAGSLSRTHNVRN
jgi:hypothetical protein